MKASNLFVLILALGGCAAELRPAPTAQVLPGPGRPATAASAGVRLVAQVGLWQGYPASLGGVATPILVTIDNQSAVPLKIRPSDFALVTGDGHRFAAQTPSEMHSAVADPGPPVYAFPRSHVVAARDPAGRVILYEPFPDDLFPSYASSGSMWTTLPTDDMIQLALPQRTLEPHAIVSGFLYFPRLARSISSVDLTASLVAERTGAPVATLTIPFVVR